jgi:hypothetical protein
MGPPSAAVYDVSRAFGAGCDSRRTISHAALAPQTKPWCISGSHASEHRPYPSLGRIGPVLATAEARPRFVINATRTEWGTSPQSSTSLSRRPAEVIRSASHSGSGVNRSQRQKSVRAVPARSRSVQPRCGTCRRRRTCRQREWSVAGTGHGHTRPRDCTRCRPPTDKRRRRSIGQSRVALRLGPRDCGCRRAGCRSRRASPRPSVSPVVS